MKKTTFSEKLGYGIASLGDAVAYSFISIFFLFFLTTVVHIPPAIAGTILAAGSIWNAIINPILGYFADRVRTKYGRRRPVMLVFSVLLGFVIFVMFTDAGFSGTVNSVYYGFMMLLFWSSYTGFFIPYCALGVDYAADYDDRTSIRSFASFFNMVGNLFSMVMPTMIVEFLESRGFSTAGAWSTTGAFLGVITFLSIIITVAVSKKKDLPCPKEEKAEKNIGGALVIIRIFKEYISIAGLKPMRYLIAASLLSLIAGTMIMSDMIYYFTYNQGLSAGQISACLALRVVIGMVMILFINKAAMRFDKRETLTGCFATGTIGLTIIKCIHPAGNIAYIFFTAMCTLTYWQVMPAIYYDMCEYDWKQTGKRREATILSFQGLIEAAAAGIGGQLLGVILQFAGFNGDLAVQAPGAMLWIENATTVVPAVFLLLAIAALYRYPLNRKVLES